VHAITVSTALRCDHGRVEAGQPTRDDLADAPLVADLPTRCIAGGKRTTAGSAA
jgi:hypothetical protein